MFSLKASPPDSPLPFREGKQVLTARCIEEEETTVSRRSVFTLGQAWPPAVIVDHDIDVIRVVEGRRAAIERSVVELPFGGPRAELEWRAARSASKTRARTRHGRGRWQNRFGTRQRHPAGFLVADQVTAHRDHALRTLRPERREDIGSPRSPIEAGENRLLDLESVQKVFGTDGKHRRLTVPDRCT